MLNYPHQLAIQHPAKQVEELVIGVVLLPHRSTICKKRRLQHKCLDSLCLSCINEVDGSLQRSTQSPHTCIVAVLLHSEVYFGPSCFFEQLQMQRTLQITSASICIALCIRICTMHLLLQPYCPRTTEPPRSAALHSPKPSTKAEMPARILDASTLSSACCMHALLWCCTTKSANVNVKIKDGWVPH